MQFMSGSVPTGYRQALSTSERDMSSLSASIVTRAAVFCIVGLVLTGCGHDPVRRAPQSNADSRLQTVTIARQQRPGEQAAIVAVGQIGVPYRYGGSSARGFDCSGLVQYAWSKAGAKIPRTTSEQWRLIAPISNKDLRAGDLLFFRIDGRISHVGLYLGDRRFVHAPATGREVSVADLDSDFYRRAFVRGARPD
jgi:cell wall-associated NlpC family hydrolase